MVSTLVKELQGVHARLSHIAAPNITVLLCRPGSSHIYHQRADFVHPCVL